MTAPTDHDREALVKLLSFARAAHRYEEAEVRRRLEELVAGCDATLSAPCAEPSPHEALHASAPAEHKCADCTMDKEPCPVCYAAWWKLKHHNCSLVGGEQTAETVGDGLCEESDGCPTEIAVLQRFWRKMQTADTVNVPTERRIDLVDPLQFLVELKHLKRRIEAGTATEPEVKFYESNKETAWVNAEHALAAAKERK